MNHDKQPNLIRIPLEIRMMIYEHLLGGDGSKHMAIRSQPLRNISDAGSKPRRTLYPILSKSIGQPAYTATYALNSIHPIYPAILSVNRMIHEEGSYYLYGRHDFRFGQDLDAVAPFLADRTPSTRDLIRSITLYKQIPINPTGHDSHGWTAICQSLGRLKQLTTLTIIVGCGQPQQPWDGPQELSVSDLRLLYSTRHELLDWVRELAGLDRIGNLVIAADVQPLAVPNAHAMLVTAAFSASIGSSLIQFLRDDLGVAATVAKKLGDQEAGFMYQMGD
ncbi:hypothetical protein CDV31_002063 [Fusarium ambrosium]|uniref:DUF7730 domain-containing protein n=1 Tax=Fusarium ambrosium TaxID=131363 RepID=A0A428UXZ9_9HYPO|nr:hypothetical protein CDV31_002063 [Fusarium ambrosium]